MLISKISLELDNHSLDLTYNTLSIVYESNKFPWGITHFLFFEKASIIYIFCGDKKHQVV